MFGLIFYASTLFAQGEEFLPSGSCPKIVHYQYYSFCYDKNHRQASWTKHQITLERINGKQKRTNDYRADHKMNDAVTERDYKGSGFDRGHLVPAADMKLNRDMMSETFYMTNMSPQVPSLNRGLWAKIETHMRSAVKNHGDAHVITAPILSSDLPRIQSGVSIPDAYYKLAYFPKARMMLAFLVENRAYDSKVKIEQVQVTVRQVEEVTGYDFFSELPDELEDQLETQI